jgi:Lon protease-like protein
MPRADRPILGMFPLGVVLLPGEMLPLHIFEERYKRLIGERRRDGLEFGIVLQREEAIAEVGCSTRLIEVIEEYEDGRLDVILEGRRPFQLLELDRPTDPDRDYLRAEVEFCEDSPGEADEATRQAAVERFRRVLVLVGVDSPQMPGGDVPLSYLLAGSIDLGVALKQQLLELRSEQERLARLVAVMEQLMPRLEAQRRRRDAIRGNGKGT